jgi:hypothetical protein
MNKSQKVLTVVFLALFTITLVWFPWFPFLHSYGIPYPPFFLWQPHYSDRVDRLVMHVEWLWLAVVYGGLFFVLKTKDFLAGPHSGKGKASDITRPDVEPY